MTDAVRISDTGSVRTIVLDRPEKKNALTDTLGWSIVDAIDAAAADDAVRVVAITGSGDTFCAGLDLSGAPRFTPLSAQSAQLDDLNWVSQMVLAMRRRCDKPVVAGVNGAAVGAGLGLALAADVRLVARSARLMAGYTRIGGSPDGGLTVTLLEALGHEGAMRFMMENRTVLGDEAVAMGLAGEVVDDAAFDTRLQAYCQSIAAWSPITLRLLKRGLVKAGEAPDLEQQLRYELSNIRIAFGSEDAKEARAAFFEKRAPVFHGR